MDSTVILDFDGDVHDTFGFHLERTRLFFGVELTEQEYRDMHNGNFYEGIPSQLATADWYVYRDHIAPEFVALRTKTRVVDALTALADRSRLHIVSAGGTRIIDEYLRNNGIRGLFSEVLGGDFHRSKAHRINHIGEKFGAGPDTPTFFVSDTLGDVLEGKLSGAVTVALDSGYHDRTTLLRGCPHHVISDLSELPGII